MHADDVDAVLLCVDVPGVIFSYDRPCVTRRDIDDHGHQINEAVIFVHGQLEKLICAKPLSDGYQIDPPNYRHHQYTVTDEIQCATDLWQQCEIHKHRV